MPRAINNEAELRPLLLSGATWRALCWWQADVITAAEAARLLGLSENDADWLRRVALASAREKRAAT